MREYQPIASAHPSRVGQRCPKCPQSRMICVKVEPGQADGDCRTFECQRCGHAETLIVSSDALIVSSDALIVSSDTMESDIRGRLDDELTSSA
jgi:hypothetical protein